MPRDCRFYSKINWLTAETFGLAQLLFWTLSSCLLVIGRILQLIFDIWRFVEVFSKYLAIFTAVHLRAIVRLTFLHYIPITPHYILLFSAWKWTWDFYSPYSYLFRLFSFPLMPTLPMNHNTKYLSPIWLVRSSWKNWKKCPKASAIFTQFQPIKQVLYFVLCRTEGKNWPNWPAHDTCSKFKQRGKTRAIAANVGRYFIKFDSDRIYF